MIIIDAWKIVEGHQRFKLASMYGLNFPTYHVPYRMDSGHPGFGKCDTRPFHSVTVRKSHRSNSVRIIESFLQGTLQEN